MDLLLGGFADPLNEDSLS